MAWAGQQPLFKPMQTRRSPLLFVPHWAKCPQMTDFSTTSSRLEAFRVYHFTGSVVFELKNRACRCAIFYRYEHRRPLTTRSTVLDIVLGAGAVWH